MDTVIFCGKSLRSSYNNNGNHNENNNHNIPGSMKSSVKPKVPNGSSLEPRITPCHTVNKSSNQTLNLIQQQQQQQQLLQSSPVPQASSTASSTSPLHNHLTVVQHSMDVCIKHKNQLDKKCFNTKKLVCDIGTSPLHKSLNCSNTLNKIAKCDELWIDKPKRAKRKKPPQPRISGVELWVDGPHAVPLNQPNESSQCVDYTDKQQRITEWVNQHAKTVLIANQSCTGSCKTPVKNTTPATSSKSNSSNGANGTCIELINLPSPYHVRVSESKIKEKNNISQDKIIETKEMACQTDQIDSQNGEKEKKSVLQELNTEETLILLSNLHDDDELQNDDWTDGRRLMLLERGALSDCCDNQICCCCSSPLTSDGEEDDVLKDEKNVKDDNNGKTEINVNSEKNGENQNNLDNVEIKSESNDLTEPPGQLKLEQFLKQLITVTNPILNNKLNNDTDSDNLKNKKINNENIHRHHQHHNHHHHHHHQNHQHSEEKKHQNYTNYDSLPPRRLTRSRLHGSRYFVYGSHQDLTHCIANEARNGSVIDSSVEEKTCVPVNFVITNDLPITDDCPKNHVAFIPTSPRINRILGKLLLLNC